MIYFLQIKARQCNLSRSIKGGCWLERIISDCSIVVAVRDQVSCDLAGEAVILHLKSGVYYGLDAVAARVWRLIQTPITVSDICDRLLHEYDVDPGQCRRDLLILLEALAAHQLIEVKNGINS